MKDIVYNGIEIDEKAQEILVLANEDEYNELKTTDVVKNTDYSPYIVRTRFETLQDAGLGDLREERVTESDGSKKPAKVFRLSQEGHDVVKQYRLRYRDGLSLGQRVERLERQQDDILNRVDKLENRVDRLVTVIEGETEDINRDYEDVLDELDELRDDIDRVEGFITDAIQ